MNDINTELLHSNFQPLLCMTNKALSLCCCFRMSDDDGLESTQSFRIPMFDWFQGFLESAVSFGDGAKEVVKVLFKYCNCLKGKFVKCQWTLLANECVVFLLCV